MGRQGDEYDIDGYNIEGDDNSLEIVGWRENKTFKSLNVHEGETYKKELEVTFTNEDGTETTTPATQSMRTKS